MIEEIMVGLVVTIVGTLIIYTFRLNQLYVVVPRLFSNSPLTTKGKLVELRVFNKGRAAEVEIRITLDPGVSYEIIASSDSTSSLRNSTVTIPRIPPGDDYSVLLLVEGGDFNNDRISGISSASTKGRLLRELTEVPPNFGKLLLGGIALIMLSVAPFASLEGYSKWQDIKNHDRVDQLEKSLGNVWENLDHYSNSEYRKHYSGGEFPIHLIGTVRNAKHVILKFRVINRAAAPLELHSIAEWPFSDGETEPWKYSKYQTQKISPGATEDFDVFLFWPKGKLDAATISFTMSLGML